MALKLTGAATLALALPLMIAPVDAQTVPQARDPIAPAPPQPSATAPQPVVVQPVPLPPPPPAVWAPVDAQALLTYIDGIGREGLRPADYDPDGLRRAMASNNVLTVSAAATDRFNRLSSDIALGHVRGDSRVDWHVDDKDLTDDTQRALLAGALAQHRVGEALDSLHPTHPQYLSLRAALAATAPTETAKLDLIRLNMDRWRWLPRDLGRKYVIVNIPSFHVTLVQDGAIRWKQRAIAGKLSTPTPNLAVMATGVMLNPWWEVPPSINKEVAGKAGFVAVKGKDGKVQRWRQPPGPSNALGEMKFVMYNPYNIYLHDTNARSRFNDEVRALSHGCVRTQNVKELAKLLLADDNGAWTPDKVDAQLKSKQTKQANFAKPVPVYIVYFSAAALNDGRIVTYNDMYKRDKAVLTALNTVKGSSAVAVAADKATK